MTSKIKVLSDQTINQIAAGEVIENPASVAKELIENSIDAGASSITIELSGGGLQCIRIIDDGSGMSRDDAILSLERHSTSKIREINDLQTLLSMGFRGEALASIAAISKMTILTANGTEGTRIFVDGGRMINVDPCARKRGSTIEVRSLFFNVPARKKFQKTASRCLAEIVKMITKLSLAHSTVAFKFFSHNKEIFHVQASSLTRRIYDVLGGGFLQVPTQIQADQEMCKIEGLIGSPSETRHNRTGQYLFINKRSVFCSAVNYAVYDSYATRLQTGKHPIFVLHLTINPNFIDVNVHPQKKEVRFRDEFQLKLMIRKAMSTSLQGGDSTSIMPPVSKVNFSGSNLPFFTSDRPLIFKKEGELLESERVFFDVVEDHWRNAIIGLYDAYLLLNGDLFPKLELITGSKKGLIIVDLLGAFSRVYFEKLLRNEPMQIQSLLIPITLEFAPHEALLLKTFEDDIRSIGIEMREFGSGCFIVEALSPEIGEGEVKDVLDELLTVLDPLEIKRERQKILALTTCKIIRSRKRTFTLEEGKRLLEEFLSKEYFNQCPLGRPIIVLIGKNELQKLFEKK